MTEDPWGVLREAKNDYAIGMASQGYREGTMKRLLDEYDAALAALRGQMEVLREEAAFRDEQSKDRYRDRNRARNQLNRVVDENEKLRAWLKLVAKAQHQLLDAVKLEMTDDEWAAFAAALDIDPALSTGELSE